MTTPILRARNVGVLIGGVSIVEGAKPNSRWSTSRARAASVFGDENPPTVNAPGTRGRIGTAARRASTQIIRTAHRQR